MSTRRLLLLIFFLLGAHSLPCAAHFPWLTTDRDGQVTMFFSESPQQRDYHLPPALAETPLWGRSLATPERVAIACDTIDRQELIGRQSTAPTQAELLELEQVYGIYHGSLLTYYAKHYRTSDPQRWEQLGPSAALALDVMPRQTEHGIVLKVTWQGQPLAGATATFLREGEKPEKSTSSAEGEVRFAPASTGEFAMTVGHEVRQAGTWQEKPYKVQMHYCTITLSDNSSGGEQGSAVPNDPQDAPRPQRPPHESEPAEGAAAGETTGGTSYLPPLAQPVASFGAAVAGPWLYVYGGHVGQAHHHSRDNLSPGFARIDLETREAWENLPQPQPLQGLALVSWGEAVYRVGGMTARNRDGEPDDLHSVATFARFNGSTREWTELAPLPEPRSSHDAVVLGDDLYVAGGWQLAGKSPGQWLTTVWKISLSQSSATWQPLAPLPSARRAVAVSHWQGGLVVLGGMAPDDEVTRRVERLDLATGLWSSLPDLPGDGMDGFGVSAWNQGGGLYACGTDGTLYRLSDAGTAWLSHGLLKQARFFHRLLPGDAEHLLVIAGTSLGSGHLGTTERVEVR